MNKGKFMDISLEDLAKEVGCQIQTLKIMLDRAEFSNIRPIRYTQMVYGITEEQIERIKKLRCRIKFPSRWKER
jgi:hypothetical protein